MGKVEEKRHPSYIVLCNKAKQAGVTLLAYILLNEVYQGKENWKQFAGLGFSQNLLKYHFSKLCEDGLINQSSPPFKLTAEGEKLFSREYILPWHDSDEFWDVWNEWLEYRKSQFKKVYTPISQNTALRNLVKWSGGDLEIAIEGILWTISKEWQGFDYGIKEYIRAKESAQTNEHRGRQGRSVDSSRTDVLEQIMRRNQS